MATSLPDCSCRSRVRRQDGAFRRTPCGASLERHWHRTFDFARLALLEALRLDDCCG
jgi:hypothetical protein